MPCVSIGNAIVCGPGATYRRTRWHCPACDRNRNFAVRFDGYYHGETCMCCACGYTEMDGCPVAVYPDSVHTANRWWVEALSPREYRAEVRAVERRYQDYDA